MDTLDRDLIIRASEGDVDSFEQIYKAYSGFVYNLALRVGRNKDDANEVTQDVFMSIYRNLKNFKFNSSFKTWVYRVATNYSINYAKKRSKVNDRTIEYSDSLDSHTTESEISANIEKEHRSFVIKKMLDMLNPEYRICMVLRHIEGLSYEEIADLLRVNINTVRTRLKRARERLLAARKEVVNNEV
ncbi:RNA polymerase sigma factor [Candidatus Omnitrophota bacterium]